MALVDGWGITPLLSVYTDGGLVNLAGTPRSHVSVAASGRGNVLAVEVAGSSCQSMRRFLADYITHPRKPESRYGLLLGTDGSEGAAASHSR